MNNVRLPTDLMPSPCADLIRLGRDHDGGYLVAWADVFAAECLVGLGLNDDWSFEEDFTRLNDCPVLAYDASVGPLVFVRRIIRALRRRNHGRHIARRMAVLAGYFQFFRGRRVHLPFFVAAEPGPRTVPFDDVARRVGRRRVFLKVDIEGAEYGILDGITALGGQLTGLVIEFHDCHHRLDQVRRFVGQIGLTLVHVHANNHGQASEAGLPYAIELTFSAATPHRHGLPGQGLPHALDQPNRADRPEQAVRFAG